MADRDDARASKDQSKHRTAGGDTPKHGVAGPWVPCEWGRQQLLQRISEELPGAQLDSSWVVLRLRRKDARGRSELSIRHPLVLPPKGFSGLRSYSAVTQYLQQLQKQQQPLPGVIFSSKKQPDAVQGSAAAAASEAGPSNNTAVLRRSTSNRHPKQDSRQGSSSNSPPPQQQPGKQQQRQLPVRKRKASSEPEERSSSGSSTPEAAAAAAAAAATASRTQMGSTRQQRKQASSVDVAPAVSDEAEQQQDQQQKRRKTAPAPAPMAAAKQGVLTLQLPPLQPQQQQQSKSGVQGRTWSAISQPRRRLRRAASAIAAAAASVTAAAAAAVVAASQQQRKPSQKVQQQQQQQQVEQASGNSTGSQPTSGQKRLRHNDLSMRRPTRQQQQQQQDEESQLEAPAAAEVATADEQEEQQQQQQQRKRSRKASSAPAPAQQQQQQQKAGSSAGAGSSSGRAAAKPAPLQQLQQQQQLRDGRLPSKDALEVVSRMLSVQLPGWQLDAAWVGYPNIRGEGEKCDPCFIHPSIPGGYLRSFRAVAMYLTKLQKLLGRDDGVPGLVKQRQQQQQVANSPAVDAAIKAALLTVGKSYVPCAQLFGGRPKQSTKSGGSSAAGGSSSGSGGGSRPIGLRRTVKPAAVRKQQPQQLFRQTAAGVLAAAKQKQKQSKLAAAAPHQQQQQQQRQQQQQQRQVSSGQGEGDASLQLLLPDGRKVSPQLYKWVSNNVTAEFPGWQLDSEWVVYPPTIGPPKHDIRIAHPELPTGHFRSLRGLLAYLEALQPLVHKKFGKKTPLPGLVPVEREQQQPKQQQQQQPGEQQQQGRALRARQQQQQQEHPAAANAAAATTAEAAAARAAIIKQALLAAAGGYIWRGPNSSRNNAAAPAAAKRVCALKQQGPVVRRKKQLVPPQLKGKLSNSSNSTVARRRSAAAGAAAGTSKASGSKAGSGKASSSKSGSSKAGTSKGGVRKPSSSSRAPTSKALVSRAIVNRAVITKQKQRLVYGGLFPGSADKMIWRHPPVDREFDLPAKGPVLVLGMFFASAAAVQEANEGMAAHRDRARLLQLQQGLGYKPHSFDRDGREAQSERGWHVQGNFNSLRGARDVSARFPGVKFNAIFLDYFRIPTGYAAEMYKAQLFTQFIPELIRTGAAAPGVAVYIPHNPVLLDQLAKAGAFATGYKEVVAIPGECYPLYRATALAQAAKQLRGGYSNDSEVRQLPVGSEFVVMRCYATPAASGS